METKLPTYWNTSFSKICLGMKIDQQLRFIVINMEADSLYSLIADGQYRSTSLGRDTWRSLIGPKASCQIYCNREGFNLYSLNPYWESRAAKARIGFCHQNFITISIIGAINGAMIGAIIRATRVVRFVRLIFHLFCLLNNNFLLFPINELFNTIPIIGA